MALLSREEVQDILRVNKWIESLKVKQRPGSSRVLEVEVECGVEPLGLDLEDVAVKINVVFGDTGVERATFALKATFENREVSVKHLDLDRGHPVVRQLEKKGIDPKLHQTYMFPDEDGVETRVNLEFWPRDLRSLWEHFKKEVNLAGGPAERELYRHLKAPVPYK